jgi:hypothetical protein
MNCKFKGGYKIMSIKLSDVNDSTKLCVSNMGDGDIAVMTKLDFLDSSQFLDMDKNDKETIPDISIAEPMTANFSFENVLENLADEMHEDWQEDVTYDLNKVLDLKEIEDKINKVFAKNPTYYEGTFVEIDMERGAK